MSLRKKTLLITGITLACLFLILYIAANFMIRNSFVQMEEDHALDNLRRIETAFQEDIIALDMTAFDWATWDETYQFIENVNEDYITNHLSNPNFVNLRLNFMVFLNLSGEVIYEKGFNLDEEQKAPVPAGIAELAADLFSQESVDDINGLVLLPEGPVIFGSRPIVTSEGTGPARGTLVVGRLLGHNEVQRLSQRTLMPVEAFPYNQFILPPSSLAGGDNSGSSFINRINTRTITASKVLDDVFGNPSIVLQADMPREIYLAGRNLIRRLIFSFMGIGFLLSAAILIFLEKTVLSRISFLSDGIREIGDSGSLVKRLEVQSQNDELSLLSGNINRMLDELEHSQQRMLITDNMLDLVVQVDVQGTIQYVSPSHKVILGYDSDEMLGTSVFNLIHPDDLPAVLNAHQSAMLSLHPERAEFRYLHADGRYIWIESIGNPLYNEGGEHDGVIISSRDITDRKEIEEQLKYLSLYDSLTSLYNRTYFEQEMKRLKNSRNTPVAVIVCDVDGLKLSNDSLGHDAGDELLKAAAMVIKESFRQEDIVARIGGDEFAVLLPNSTPELVAQANRRIREAINDYNNTKPQHYLSISIGYAIGDNSAHIGDLFKEADNNMYREKLHHSQSARSATVQILMKALEARDFVTEGHADRLQELVAVIGKALGFTDSKMTSLRLLAQFHDIGKVGIPDRILFKRGQLSKEEREEMQRHCEIGHRIDLSAPDLVPIADWILKHQEWWNGRGYPFGLRGDDIPLECRILAIADAYDAITSNRPYRKALSHEKAIDELKKCAGKQFDPQLVKIFVNIFHIDTDEKETALSSR